MEKIRAGAGETTRGWKQAKVILGDRAGEPVLTQPEDSRGLCQVVFSTGAMGLYLRSDLEIQEEESHGG